MRHIVMKLVKHIFDLTNGINPIPPPENFRITDDAAPTFRTTDTGDFRVTDN